LAGADQQQTISITTWLAIHPNL